MDTDKTGIISLPKRSVPLTPEQTKQLSAAKKAMLIAAADKNTVIKRG